jgi:hypothetical protein
MQPYKNEKGGITAFEIGNDWMIILFNDGRKYLYSHIKPGEKYLEAMKKLALQNEGLTSYINKHVRKNYEKEIISK